MTKITHKRIFIFIIISIIAHFLVLSYKTKANNLKFEKKFINITINSKIFQNKKKEKKIIKKIQKTKKNNNKINKNNTNSSKTTLKSSLKRGEQNNYISLISTLINQRLQSSNILLRQIKGFVLAKIIIDSDGTVIKKEVLENSNNVLKQAVIRAISDKYLKPPNNEKIIIITRFTFN